MSALAPITSLIGVEEYLATEELALTRHEYIEGIVRDRADAGESHNRIATNLNGLLATHLRGGGTCEFFGSNMRLKWECEGAIRFYYADGMVSCDPTEEGNDFRQRPSILFEIVSEATRTIDEGEKLTAYCRMPSLQAYVCIEEAQPKVRVERRSKSGWDHRQITGLDAVADIGVLRIELPLCELYRRVVFPS